MQLLRSDDADQIDRAFSILAATTANPELGQKFERARRAFSQNVGGGRPGLDDRQAINEAVRLYETGRVPTLNSGFHHVARKYYPDADPKSTAERLRRKHAQIEKTSTNQV